MVGELILLRESTPEDVTFLARLYCDVRSQEVSGWGWSPEQQAWFLRMQFDAQRRSYQASFPYAADSIVQLKDLPVGRVLVYRESSATHLIDIALLAAHRNSGIGTHLLRGLLQDCQEKGLPLHLQVAQGNPATRLYQRLGFRQISADPMYIQMQWIPLPCQKGLAC
jgi:ribosomal protein S18 acetylase RimI-like enzyme